MTDPTPTPAPVVVPAPAPVTAAPPSSSVVTTVENDAKAIEAKAVSFWAYLGAHPVLITLVVGAAVVGVLSFLRIL